MVMQHFEVHFIETELDIDLGLQSGLLTVEQLDASECAECSNLLGHSADSFESFAIIIDENDRDWSLCSECSGPLIYANSFFDSSDSVEFLARLELAGDDDLEHF